MAWDCNVVVMSRPYNDKLPDQILHLIDTVLRSFRIRVIARVEEDEYKRFTSSRETNRYLRIPASLMSERDKEAKQEDMVKVGTFRYPFERFASAKYGFYSISSLEGKTVIWMSFHSKLPLVLPGFDMFPIMLSQRISSIFATESLVLSTTSRSRHSDLFVLHFAGQEKNKLTGKNALTEVKNSYNVDINRCMDNIDHNLAICYAKSDYADIRERIKEEQYRYEALLRLRAEAEKKIAEGTELSEPKELSEEEANNARLIDLQEANDASMKALEAEYERVRQALMATPIGDVVYFKMDDHHVDSSTAIPHSEREFGRPVGTL